MNINFFTLQEGKLTPGYVPVQRVVTGLYSFDRAFHREEIGPALSGIIEIFGKEGVGKSTFAYSLASIVGKIWDSSISIVDVEGFDPVYVNDIFSYHQYSGDVFIILEGDHEVSLDRLVTKSKEGTRISILDSIGAISPFSEKEGELGEANMGRRAKLMAQFSRKFIQTNLGKNDRFVLCTNHVYQNLGAPGTYTPGGKNKDFFAPIRLHLWNKKISDSLDPGVGKLVQGVVKKNRFGGDGRTFQVILLGNKGIHYGLTALFDAADLGIVSRGRTVKMGDHSFGYLKDIFKEAQEGNDEFFTPVIEALKNV